MKNTEIRFYSHFTHFYFKDDYVLCNSRLLEENIFCFFFKHTYILNDQTSLRVLAHRVVIANELTFKYQCPPVTSFFLRADKMQTLQLAKQLCLNLRDTEIKFSKTFNILQLNRLLVNKMIHINQAPYMSKKTKFNFLFLHSTQILLFFI